MALIEQAKVSINDVPGLDDASYGAFIQDFINKHNDSLLPVLIIDLSVGTPNIDCQV